MRKIEIAWEFERGFNLSLCCQPGEGVKADCFGSSLIYAVKVGRNLNSKQFGDEEYAEYVVSLPNEDFINLLLSDEYETVLRIFSFDERDEYNRLLGEKNRNDSRR